MTLESRKRKLFGKYVPPNIDILFQQLLTKIEEFCLENLEI